LFSLVERVLFKFVLLHCFQHHIFISLENDPTCAQPTRCLTIEEQRERAHRLTKRFFEYDFLPDSEVMANPQLANEIVNTLGLFEWSASAKYMLDRQVSFVLDVGTFYLSIHSK
jgi:hypothetical protein